MGVFADRLFEAVRAKESAVVVGLDPNLALMPESVFARRGSGRSAREKAAQGVRAFLEEIIVSVRDVAVAVKPQLAYFEQLGPWGMETYEAVVGTARVNGLLVITDGKRNDIAQTAEAYASAYLGPKDQSPPQTAQSAKEEALRAIDQEGPKADALTLNPYLGMDGLRPFLARTNAGQGLFVLVRTSNPSSGELQQLETAKGPVAKVVAGWLEELCEADRGAYDYGDVGAVVGATHPQELTRLRAAMPHVPFLIPGFGAQGAGASDAALGFDSRGLGAVVNASRSILYAYRRFDAPFGEAAKRAATQMRDAIRRAAPLH